MLKLNDVHVDYGHFHALQGISFEIKEGEIVALLGSNGAGKTTTINTISGLTTPVKGEVIYKGQVINDMRPNDRVQMGIVQVPEGRKLFPYMTVMDNLLVGSFNKQARQYRKESLEMCFDLFPNLHERRNQFAGTLSGGEQQMVAVSRAIMSHPEIIMFDEPSLGLAPVVVEDVFENIMKLHDMGRTILLVEQNVMLSLEIADRAYVIENGQNVKEGKAKDLLADESIRQAYLGI